MIKPVLRTLMAFIIGSVIALYCLQEDSYVQKMLQKKIIHIFESSFDCQVRGNITKVNFFSGYLEGKNIIVTPKNEDTWSWETDIIQASFSWFDFFIHRSLCLEISAQDIHVFSKISNNTLSISTHLKKMIEGSVGLPVKLKMLSIKKGTLDIADKNSAIKATSNFSLQLSALPERLRIMLYLTQGFIAHQENNIMHALNATINFEKQLDNSLKEVNISLVVDAQALLDNVCESQQHLNIFGRFVGNQGKVSLATKDNTCFVNIDLDDTLQGTHVAQAHLPLDMINSIVQKKLDQSLQGIADVELVIQGHNNDITGTIRASDISFHGYNAGSINIQAQRINHLWSGSITSKNTVLGVLKFLFSTAPDTKAITIDLTNHATINLFNTPYWTINPQKLVASCNYSNGTLQGNYFVTAQHIKIDNSVTTEGTLSYDSNTLNIEGAHDNKKYTCSILLPDFIIKNFKYGDKNNYQPLVKAWSSCENNQHSINADIRYDLVRFLLSNILNVDPSGEGMFHISASLKDYIIKGTIELDKSNIRLIPTYNFIRDLHSSFTVDLAKKHILINDFALGLHKGTISSNRAKIYFDQQGISFMHIPLVIQNLFLNIDKNLYTTTSGFVLFEKNETPAIRGRLFIDRGQLTKNIFSIQMQHYLAQAVGTSLFPHTLDALYDITVETKKPLHIKTSFLETDASAVLSIKGSVNNPTVSGKINLSMGTLGFPYKKLYITNCVLYFLPNQLKDPVIELTAQGKIKKYQITLRASGSLQNPHITFESSPPLTEEQILTLLLAGSENGSFALVMPALIMQNVHNIIFGPDQTSSKLETYFKNILEPFRYIRIIPSFTDLSGRGGFKGSIEIDVNDQLHGLIQKNFSLPEDTRFEVEYNLSDDISLRSIKDERGDLGGEVEMRWKF